MLCISAMAFAQTAATSAPDTVYWCLMRGKPCAKKDFSAPGKCPECGMQLVTKKEYDAYMAKYHANAVRVGVLLYPAYETLDVFGPIELFSFLQEFEVVTVAEKSGVVTNAQGVRTEVDYSFADCPKLNILLVPGGMGTLNELKNEKLLQFIRDRHAESDITASVCSGSALLAKAGVLDGHKATSNKLYFDLAQMQSEKVEWIKKARWVDDGKVVTSSGVSAGMDMTLHLIGRLYGEERALKAARQAEYVWNRDPANDPFATESDKK